MQEWTSSIHAVNCRLVVVLYPIIFPPVTVQPVLDDFTVLGKTDGIEGGILTFTPDRTQIVDKTPLVSVSSTEEP